MQFYYIRQNILLDVVQLNITENHRIVGLKEDEMNL